MKRRKLLFALAMVFAALAFGLKANAQDPPNVQVLFSYTGYQTTPYNFEIDLYNITTGDTYQRFVYSNNYEPEPGVFKLSSVPEGNYIVSVKVRISGEYRVNWHAKGLSGNNVLLNTYQYYEILNDVALISSGNEQEDGIRIVLEDW